MNLTNIGWTADRATEFDPLHQQGFYPGRVAISYGSSVIAWTENGEISASVAGRLKMGREDEIEQGPPVVGDWVALRPGEGTSSVLVHAVLQRRTAFIRKVAGSQTRPQVVAANVDRVIIVTSLNSEFSTNRLERYLTLTRESGAEPIVVLNKTDLAGDDLADYISEAKQVAGDAPVQAVCAITGDTVEAMLPFFEVGKTVALLGSSGVGKSTIINRLLGEERMSTQEVRNDDRGRHTTTRRELLVLPGGALVIDTPGMRELQIWDGSVGVQEAFEDVLALAPTCRFRDCSHTSEPGCAVRTAVEQGTLDADRYDSYIRLQTEVNAADIRKVELGRTEKKRQEKIGSRTMKSVKKKP